MLQLDVEPDGVVRRRAAGDLQRFNDHVESRGTATPT